LNLFIPGRHILYAFDRGYDFVLSIIRNNKAFYVLNILKFFF